MESPDQRWARFPNDEDSDYGSRYFTPLDTREEILVRQATDANRLPEAELRLTPPADLWRVAPVRPPRARGALGVEDVLGAARLYQDAARDYSGSPAGFTGSLRYSMGGW